MTARNRHQLLPVLLLTLASANCTHIRKDCVSVCQESGCGASVGGGCYHLCGKARPSARRAQYERFETLARQRTLENAATSSSFVGVITVRAVREISLYETLIDAAVVSTWAGATPEQLVQISVAGRDYCDPTAYQARPDEDAVVFLVSEAAGEPYKIAGFGWGFLSIAPSDAGPVAIGYPPPPRSLSHATQLDPYRVPTWRVSVAELRDAVALLRGHPQ